MSLVYIYVVLVSGKHGAGWPPWVLSSFEPPLEGFPVQSQLQNKPFYLEYKACIPLSPIYCCLNWLNVHSWSRMHTAVHMWLWGTRPYCHHYIQ